MDIKYLHEEAGYTPKRKAACHGGKYFSSCPFCKDGDDRFLIWPNRHNKSGEYQGGHFSCRVCGKFGDAITFLRELYGMSYLNACEQLKLKPKERQLTAVTSRSCKAPLIVIDPTALWIEKATACVKWCHSQLMSTPSALAKIQGRGFTTESIIRYKIGFNPGDAQERDLRRNREDWGLDEVIKEDGTYRKLWLPVGFTIPTFASDGKAIKVKIRRSSWEEGDKLPKYVEVSGSRSSPSVYGDASLPLGLVLESEFDGLLFQQEAADLLYCVALGGSTKPIDVYTDNLLRRTMRILFLPDFDQAGAIVWVKWQRLFPGIQRILTPNEKSAGDYFLAGGDLRKWLLEASTDNPR